ncbi:helix-turn-helix transcriptional regulator [Agromyces sp. ISL-38]|uniref:helix-turn-helix domain-containing protein n=1 Tax=Agromyces sp. ISL-38 TaxID=2819107 RepID=UPI001BE67FDB|nr:XRE family transcriptional regulator [Agromyces sp. ISL-38]MBT2497879.1 helix-turn-helix transcriptional regulator [Agromyces sp. ISL-38]MBT2517031.1 helix-turn-helix transcriptional regulator [Streptomyces sp. ISL-90]
MPRVKQGAHNEGVAIDRQVELVGARIRSLRRARSLTLVQVAELSGLSHPFLSQVENGRARPSFASLERIARALGTTQVELFAALAQSAPAAMPTSGAVVIDEGVGVSGPFAEGSARVLVTGASAFTPMEFIARNRDFGEYFVHDEEEFCYVVDGLVEGDFGGAETRVLHAGQAFYYRGGTPHRWRSPDGGVYRVLVVKQRIQPDAGTSPGLTPGPTPGAERTGS